MRAGFLAVLGVILAIAAFLPSLSLETPKDFDLYRNLALIVVTAALALEALIVSRKEKAKAILTKEEAKHRTSLTKQLEEKENESSALLAKLKTLESERKDLSDAYEQAKKCLQRFEEELRAKAAAPRDEDVLNLLSLLQSRGRFVDFLMDDIAKYSDAQVGAAARIVHQGCSSVIREYFEIKPVRVESEGASLTLDPDYDSRAFRLMGKIQGAPPFRGKLLHRGWLTTAVRLPERLETQTPQARGIIAPAEIELH